MAGLVLDCGAVGVEQVHEVQMLSPELTESLRNDLDHLVNIWNCASLRGTLAVMPKYMGLLPFDVGGHTRSGRFPSG